MNIQDYPYKKISLIELQEYYHVKSYMELVELVENLIEKQLIEAIKSSKGNGKKPTLYNSYRIKRTEELNDSIVEELLYLSNRLNNDYYLKNKKAYLEDRKYILQLNDFMLRTIHQELPNASINERSFEIFSREKFLTKEGGMRILRNLGLSLDDIRVYETTEPLAYYSNNKDIPQTILFVENKDTFYSMRRHLLKGNTTILGEKIDTIVYGGGKAIYRSIQDFELCVEPYMLHEANRYLYFGDLDYEGILIFEKLRSIASSSRTIIPFVRAYEAMVRKSEKHTLPMTKEKQNRNSGDIFLAFFCPKSNQRIKNILEKEKYIPQEILQERDFTCTEDEDGI